MHGDSTSSLLLYWQERMELKEAQRKAALPKSKLQLRRIAENEEIKKHGSYCDLVR